MMKRVLSMMLALLMAFSTFGVFCTIPDSVSAAEADGPLGDGGVEEEGTAKDDKYVAIVDAALTTSYESAQDKIDSDENMRLAAKYGNLYALYINDYTGEVALKDLTTGQILTSNPYDVPNYNSISESTRAQLLSQISLKYTDNGTSKTFYSYTEAAARGQIEVKNIRNGIRVEYAIGREDANYLVPGMITEERMISQIFSVMEPNLEEYGYKYLVANVNSLRYDTGKLLSFYILVDPNDKEQTDSTILGFLQAYPVIKKLGKAVYIRTSSTARDKRMLENIIKAYCPNYSYEELEKDHAETQYVSDELDPPLFKMALEYTLGDDGMTVRLPANGIRFDTSLYALDSITMLQYFGAGNMNNDGYLFYPDGSGTILYYEDLVNRMATEITGKVYGSDYAYHEISGKHQESIRMPVFGSVSTLEEAVLDVDGNPITTPDENGNPITETKKVTTGFLAIVEEGEAMANICASWGGTRHCYTSAYTTLYPRPKDSYDLSDSISVGSNSTWTVESSRRYTGSYKLRIVMLSDAEKQPALEAAGRNYYEASYVGMAKAYNNYLVNVAEVLKPLSASDVKENIPLYIEAFGTVPDMMRIASIPVEVDIPLTTFDNIQTMYKELSEGGITNVNFKLTGFANGGMYSTYPCKLDWMNEVGGADGFKNLLAAAKENGYGVYPEFDFMYITNEALFDGISLSDAGARTIDNRYSSKKVYDATYQEFVSFYDICVTPAMVEVYYERFAGSFRGYGPIGISVSTMGSDLNSDFGKDNPTNREDAKKIIKDIFGDLQNDYGSVMSSGGNVYALQYVEHLLDAALDSSRFTYTSRSVPFVGMVLHGYVNYTGGAINMAGNVNYQVLKAIENGAGIYFTLSYDNTELLKEFDDLSDYYSVDYQIWTQGSYDAQGNLIEKGDLFTIYDRVNSAIKSLQTSKIVDHHFLIGERVPSASEQAEYDALVAEALREAETIANDAAKKALLAEYREKFENGEVGAGALTAEDLADLATDDEIKAVFDSFGIQSNTTDSDALAGDDYVSTKYTTDDGMIVMVSYEGGVSFILNYNVYAVNVNIDGQVYTLEAYGYQPIQK